MTVLSICTHGLDIAAERCLWCHPVIPTPSLPARPEGLSAASPSGRAESSVDEALYTGIGAITEHRLDLIFNAHANKREAEKMLLTDVADDTGHIYFEAKASMAALLDSSDRPWEDALCLLRTLALDRRADIIGAALDKTRSAERTQDEGVAA